jgi:hypothetical protein
MKRGERLRKDALRRYFVYRMKLVELFHFSLLWSALSREEFFPENKMGHSGEDFASSVRVALISWFCVIVDQSDGGLNIFKVWRELFPNDRKVIDLAWRQIEPHWDVLRSFRDRCGFHADTPQKYFEAKIKLLDNPETVKAVQDFLDLAIILVKKENKQLPDFVPEVESFLFDFELHSGRRFRRDTFKKLLILPKGHYKKVFNAH